MKILITGGCGFIGSHVTEYYVRAGHAVTVLDDLSSGRRANLKGFEKKIKLVIGDIKNANLVDRLVKRADLIVHLAAIASVPKSLKNPAETHAVNVGGSLNVLHPALGSKRNPKIIFASSAAVYGIPQKLPLTETAPIAPISPYGTHKRVVEEYGLQYHQCFGLRFTALRFFNVFGPRQDPSSAYSGVISIFMKLAKQGLSATIFGDGKQTRDFIHVDDVVQMINRCVKQKKSDGEIYNVGTGCTTNLIQLWDIVAPGVKPKFATAREGDIPCSEAAISKAKKELGFRPKITLARSLQEISAKSPQNSA